MYVIRLNHTNASFDLHYPLPPEDSTLTATAYHEDVLGLYLFTIPIATGGTLRGELPILE